MDGDNQQKTGESGEDRVFPRRHVWTVYRAAVVCGWSFFVLFIAYLEVVELPITTNPGIYAALLLTGAVVLLTTTAVIHQGLTRVEEYVTEGKERVIED